MTAAVVGSYADWVGILACLVAVMGMGARMSVAHVCRQTEVWKVLALMLGVIGTGLVIPASWPGLAGWIRITAAAVVLVGFPLLLVGVVRDEDRRFRRTQREWAVIRAAEAAAGLGSASDVGGGW